MKITKSRLLEIIREELANVLYEANPRFEDDITVGAQRRRTGRERVGPGAGAGRVRRRAGGGGLEGRPVVDDPVHGRSKGTKGARQRTTQPRRTVGPGGGQFVKLTDPNVKNAIQKALETGKPTALPGLPPALPTHPAIGPTPVLPAPHTPLPTPPRAIGQTPMLPKPPLALPGRPSPPPPAPPPPGRTPPVIKEKPWKKWRNACRDGKGRWICLIGIPVAIVSWLFWRDSDEYDEALDPIKSPLYKLYTHCGSKQELLAFPTKEARQAFMDRIKAEGGLPGCDVETPMPEMKYPPMENQPGSVAFTPAASPARPEAPAGECQFSVPPPPGNKEEFDCFYQALHYSGGSSGLEFLEEYGQDYLWKDEHTVAYYELLQTGYHHNNIPTHEELQKYRWYKQVPEHVKDFFKTAQSG